MAQKKKDINLGCLDMGGGPRPPITDEERKEKRRLFCLDYPNHPHCIEGGVPDAGPIQKILGWIQWHWWNLTRSKKG